MKRQCLDLLGVPGETNPLVFRGEECGDELFNGYFVTQEEDEVPEMPIGLVVDGIGAFGSPCADWPSDAVKSLIKGKWIYHNWSNEIESANDESSLRKPFCDTLAHMDGPVLEIAAGPGGGNMAPILTRNHEAWLIVNDWSFRVLSLWKHFVGLENFPSLSFAAFDARHMPLRDACLAAISSSGGFRVLTPPSRPLQKRTVPSDPVELCMPWK